MCVYKEKKITEKCTIKETIKKILATDYVCVTVYLGYTHSVLDGT